MRRRRAWWLAVRPKTLSAAVAPVAVGTALAAHDGRFGAVAAFAALLGAVLIQVGTNLANDVLDYRRGADHAERLGPVRVTQSGLLPPGQVAGGAALCFAAAAGVGLYLVHVAGLPILALGVLAIASGVLYTAGPVPLAYVGLGDVFVLLFFGPVAVVGTYYVQTLTVSRQALLLGLAVGALAVAILNVNNLRDARTDLAAGKRTLAARLGPRSARRYFALVVLTAFLLPMGMVGARLLPWTCLAVLAAAPAATRLVRAVTGGVEGRALNPWLGAAARLQLVHAGLLCAGLAGAWVAARPPSGP